MLAQPAIGTIQGQTLRSLADARGIHFGAAVTFPSSPAVYDTTLARQFNGVVCENAMKFGNIMTGPNTFSYTEADAIVNFGVAHGMYVRGHTFIWHKQSPTWFANLSVSRDSAFKIMKRYITTEMTHYKGKVKEWDIVNEAVARDSSGMRPGSGYPEADQNSKWAELTDAANHNFFLYRFRLCLCPPGRFQRSALLQRLQLRGNGQEIRPGIRHRIPPEK